MGTQRLASTSRGANREDWSSSFALSTNANALSNVKSDLVRTSGRRVSRLCPPWQGGRHAFCGRGSLDSLRLPMVPIAKGDKGNAPVSKWPSPYHCLAPLVWPDSDL